MTRRAAAAAGAALLLALVFAGHPFAEMPRRWRALLRFAPQELAVRRLGGSGTAFDRRYFSFLENTRRRLPPWSAGVEIVGVPATDAHVYLAAYHLAPLPVAFPERSAPSRPGWVLALYGGVAASESDVLARLPEGVLIGRKP